MNKFLFPTLSTPSSQWIRANFHPCHSPKATSAKSTGKATLIRGWRDEDISLGPLSSCNWNGKGYVRARHLPPLLHLFASEAERLEQAHPGILIEKLQKAIRGERRRGQVGHWRYSLARHIGLKQALSAEKELFKARHQSIPVPPPHLA